VVVFEGDRVVQLRSGGLTEPRRRAPGAPRKGLCQIAGNARWQPTQ
jgi:hypothetical protein